MSIIQDFFNNQPVVAGIIFLIIVALITLICIWIVFIIKKNKFKNKNKILNNLKHNIIEKNEIEKVDYELNIAKNSNLIIKNLKNNEINNNPTKNDFLEILNNKNYKLFLPNDDVEILLNKEKGKFITNKDINDHNLFIFNLFINFMEISNKNWYKSKFN